MENNFGICGLGTWFFVCFIDSSDSKGYFWVYHGEGKWKTKILLTNILKAEMRKWNIEILKGFLSNQLLITLSPNQEQLGNRLQRVYWDFLDFPLGNFCDAMCTWITKSNQICFIRLFLGLKKAHFRRKSGVNY